MRFGLDIPTTDEYADPRKLAELAAEAEDAGWDGFFLWDSLLGHGGAPTPLVDAWVALTAIALRTRRIRIGAFVTPVAQWHLGRLARLTVALDRLSNGRLIFGAGLGFQEIEFTAFGAQAEARIRAEQLDEALPVLERLWSGAPCEFTGHHYTIQGAQMRPPALQTPRIPIWVAGGWPRRRPLRRAARWDGLYLMTVNQETHELLTPAEVAAAAEYVRAHRARPEPCEIGVNGVTPAEGTRGAEIVSPYAEAGATWWIEYVDERDTFERYRARILAGPPRLEVPPERA